MNRIKNIRILLGIFLFLLLVKFMPVACLFKTVTGISCPSCGMTRSFYAILQFNFLEATYQNLLGIPLFIFLLYFIIMLFIEIKKNRFLFIPNFLFFLIHYCPLFFSLLFVSFLYNNLK